MCRATFRHLLRHGFIACLVLIALLLSDLQARQINWRIPSNRNNVTSDGSAISTSFVFELGCFSQGFVPTKANAGDWAKHWHLIDRTGYRNEDTAFSDTVTITSNEAPFLAGTPVYIWGYGTEIDKTEWILATASDWNIPTPAQNNDWFFTWVLTNSANIIAGEVNSTSASVFMRTVQLSGSVPALLPETWRLSAFNSEQLSDPDVSGWGADPDDDGLSNIDEYAFDTNPLVANHIPFLQLTVSAETATVLLPRKQDRLALLATEVSEDLDDWSLQDTNLTVELAKTLDYEKATYDSRIDRLFFRTVVLWFPSTD